MNADNIILTCGHCGARNRIPQNRMNDKPVCGKCRSPIAVTIINRPVDITDRTFNDEVISHPGPVLLDCWAPWCGPCRMVAPVLEQLAKEYAGKVKIAKINIDENPVTASLYNIQSIPAMLFFKNGQKVNAVVGALPKKDIEKHLRMLI